MVRQKRAGRLTCFFDILKEKRTCRRGCNNRLPCAEESKSKVILPGKVKKDLSLDENGEE